MHEVPYGFCHCGCGRKTRIASKTDRGHGYVKGEPNPFLLGHRRRRDPVERFWEKVDKNGPNGCWIWIGLRTAHPVFDYGRFFFSKNVAVAAHRFAWQLLNGPVPEGLELDHLCRNPPCVNPDHLEAVTHQENILRGNSVPAGNANATHCVHGHPFDEANTYYASDGSRSCRACGRERARAKKQMLGWITDLLDRAGVPVASYEGQGGGMCDWTSAGRVDHVLRLLVKHGIDPAEDTLRPTIPPAP